MLDLLDYRRRISELYATIRHSQKPQDAHQMFRKTRDDLFQFHQQSALSPEQKTTFQGLNYYPYDPAFRVVGDFHQRDDDEHFEVDLGDDGLLSYRRVGEVRFELPTGEGQLSVFWLEGYGGGIFLPFGDATNRNTTYGGGRYLYDTIKGADLGTDQDQMILDFNFAYNPSCAYNYHWVCPLAPEENKLSFPIPAGEQLIQFV